MNKVDLLKRRREFRKRQAEFARGRAKREKQAGYEDCAMSAPDHGWVVVYVAEAQGIDVGPDTYAVVCENHSTICGTSSIRDAGKLMRSVEFCEPCMELKEKGDPSDEFSYARNKKEISEWLRSVPSVKLVAIKVREPAWIRKVEVQDRLEKAKKAFVSHDGTSLFVEVTDEHGASLMMELEK